MELFLFEFGPHRRHFAFSENAEHMPNFLQRTVYSLYTYVCYAHAPTKLI
jgi:hypothetical protein